MGVEEEWRTARSAVRARMGLTWSIPPRLLSALLPPRIDFLLSCLCHSRGQAWVYRYVPCPCLVACTRGEYRSFSSLVLNALGAIRQASVAEYNFSGAPCKE